MTAQVEFESRTVKLAIKRSPPRSLLGAATSLVQVHEQARQLQPVYFRHSPRMLGCDPTGRWVAMDFVPGKTLESLLISSLVPFSPRRAECRQFLQSVARVLANVHQLSSRYFPQWTHPLRSNETYLENLQDQFRNVNGARGRLFGRIFDLMSDRLSPRFKESQGDRLLPVDSQAKNVLIDASGKFHLIDIDYCVGNPGLTISHFLVSLDRIALRWPIILARIDEWKATFLEAYREINPDIDEALLLFYPRALLETMSSQAFRRPRFRWWLGQFYLDRLKRFCLAVERQALPQSIDYTTPPVATFPRESCK